MSYGNEKKSQNEDNFIGFHLQYILALKMQKSAFYYHFTGVEKIFFLKTKLKQMCKGKSIGIRKSNQHALVTW